MRTKIQKEKLILFYLIFYEAPRNVFIPQLDKA